jgi:hypothetical protein
MVPEKELRVETRNADLVGLCHVRIDPVDRRNPGCVIVRATGVSEDGKEVRVPFGQPKQACKRSKAHLYRIDASLRAHQIRDVRGGGAGGGPQIQPSLPRLRERATKSFDQRRGKLTPIRVPTAQPSRLRCDQPLPVDLRWRSQRLGRRDDSVSFSDTVNPRREIFPRRPVGTRHLDCPRSCTIRRSRFWRSPLKMERPESASARAAIAASAASDRARAPRRPGGTRVIPSAWNSTP